MVAISVTRNVAKFMVADGLDEISEIQQLTRETITLYAKNIQDDTHQEPYLPRYQPCWHWK